jgi:erythromycin esterase-like protein
MMGHRPTEDEKEIVAWTREAAQPLRNVADLDPLLEAIGDARYVLLGEASHGTSEYYTWRFALSARLIREKGFSFIAVEGDWPDCYRVNRYVKGFPDSGASARNVLHAFDRWPTWMWANREVVKLAEWMRDYNEEQPHERMAGFFGLDVYSLWDSLQAVIDYLERVDPTAAVEAKQAAACFDPYHQDIEEYARVTALIPTSCEDDIVRLLASLRAKAAQYKEDGRDAYFDAEQNALVARNAERYYRAMVRWGPSSWNIRDEHMVETLERLMENHGANAKCVVWEHNTHIGDARATDMAASGMVNVGQILREDHPHEDVFAVGFGSYHGSVIAGDSWGATMRHMHVPPAREESIEALFHQAVGDDFLLMLRDASYPEALEKPRGHRAIGVVYHPQRERYGNYVPTSLPNRYDAFLHIERSHALHPLHMEAHEGHDAPETYPSGL